MFNKDIYNATIKKIFSLPFIPDISISVVGVGTRLRTTCCLSIRKNTN